MSACLITVHQDDGTTVASILVNIDDDGDEVTVIHQPSKGYYTCVTDSEQNRVVARPLDCKTDDDLPVATLADSKS